MANTSEIPFGRYYGSVDATPLYVCLAGAYHQRTADDETIAQVWPNLRAAMDWIDRSVAGQKEDSADSMFHADGRLAAYPIALCEVQGYVYSARRWMADLCRQRGEETAAVEQVRRAGELRDAFERRFWQDALGTYAMAIDGDDEVCAVRASNAAHALMFDLASPERARLIAQTLMSEHMFSGWGVRTVAVGEARYNPISYHNGSVWPHDSAIAGAGMARYGMKREALHILTGMYDASRHFDLQRLPELLCGFSRQPGQGPTRYPVACSPQTWAAGAVFLLIGACLGLTIDARTRVVSCDRPQLPPWLDWVSVEGLEVGSTRLDLVFRRADADVSVGVAKVTREREPEVVLIKRV
jgi:glycogen debranching enzyme